jgi:DeoR/GlpR family transcriptional regulator of sugar metabolism
MASTLGSVAERRRRLAEIVDSQGFCTMAELAALLGVSEMTVRRDVAQLVDQGRLSTFHGGVRAPGGQNFLGTDYAARTDQHREAKLAVGNEAVRLARSLSVIGIDSGTTGAVMAEILPDDCRLRVVTASLPVITALNTHRNVETTVLGGVLHVESQSFLGFGTANAAREVHLETFFMTASAASARGAYCTYETAAAIKRVLMDSADRVVFLTDSSKFQQGAMTRICGWEGIDTVLTDDQIDDHTVAYLESEGVTVCAVPTESPVGGQAMSGSVR